ncbi:MULTISPECIES: Spx/MgsR family RNA polymerase-binding regulatory protein [Jeotgalibacillus]|uniref:Spx/MgsR family RNA polymerase-binding regulatory protein n=1 Tax=Jeotgalibacillus TaxID=157226 RepID=UPI00106A4BCD|nr:MULTISPECIES: Spx/MgsR family RNA polymerase-binding regulatory protein [Jeotgalibacillus]TFD92280.1 Spx/MgsR family RNA polymerase-binding regulatory protein [Jeotgalibacillus sp. R-1-5s-1]
MNPITFYTYPSCTSCRKTKKWLKANDVNVTERHIFRETPDFDELMHLLTLTTDGLDELLATRSQSFKNLNRDVNDLPLSEVVKLIIEDPKLLKRPILTDGRKLIVGYNPEGLRSLSNKKQLYKLSG